MALFRRKDPDLTEPAPVLGSAANDAVQWRGRARRRLIGAVALVLAAVIVLPMALDSEPFPVASDIPIVIPERDSSYQPQFAGDGDSAGDTRPSEQRAASQTPPAAADNGARTGATAANGVNSTTGTNNTNNTNSALTSTTPSATAPSQTPVAPRANTRAPTTRASTASPEPARSDDGSRALALLEGRAASRANARDTAYVLQIAAYSSQSDAQARRDQLVKAGVSNAFVESATVNGKPQYRLRVGPFASRADAQAAQPRLRTLGYSNGFIAAQ